MGNFYKFVWFVLVLAWCQVGLAAEPAQVRLCHVGRVDTNLLSRVQAWVANNVAPVKDEGALKTSAATLEALAKGVPQPKAKEAVLILVDERKGEPRHLFREGRVVVVLTGLMKPRGESEADREIFLRRVEKEATGALAVAFGLPECPMIRCAAYAASTAAEVDEKSRNLCPPCMQKLESLLQQP